MPLGLGLCQFIASGFVPTQIAGLQLWLRADTGVTTGATFTWADQSGAGDTNRNAKQSTAAKQPTVNASDASYNHQTTLSFASASSQELDTGTWSVALAQPCTWIVVGNTDATGSSQPLFDGISGTNRQFIVGTSNVLKYFAGTIVASVYNPDTPSVIGAQFNGASSELYANNSQTPLVGGNPGAQSLTGVSIGGNGANGSGTYLNGKIAEVIAYSGALSSAQLKMVFNYLGIRYGIAVS